MLLRPLGKTKIAVSPLGFGTLTVGPFQLHMDIDRGGELIAEAVRRGINLLDTAKAYQTYPYIRRALELLTPDEKVNLHIISRSYDYTYDGMAESFGEALDAIGIQKLSIYMLHEQESKLTLQGHAPAIEYLKEMKKEGRLEAIGISTHYIAAVKAAADHPDIEVIFAIFNREGLGIMDGGAKEMEEALTYAHSREKGILLMKVLGGGHLYRNAREALEYARDLPFVHSTIIGMQDPDEVDYNRGIFDNRIPVNFPPALHREQQRELFIEPWCRGCGLCAKACPFHALHVKHGKAFVEKDKCMLCSYCARWCPDFCIKVV